MVPFIWRLRLTPGSFRILVSLGKWNTRELSVGWVT